MCLLIGINYQMIKQFDMSLISFIQGKTVHNWGSTVPHKQWNVLLEEFGVRESLLRSSNRETAQVARRSDISL